MTSENTDSPDGRPDDTVVGHPLTDAELRAALAETITAFLAAIQPFMQAMNESMRSFSASMINMRPALEQLGRAWQLQDAPGDGFSATVSAETFMVDTSVTPEGAQGRSGVREPGIAELELFSPAIPHDIDKRRTEYRITATDRSEFLCYPRSWDRGIHLLGTIGNALELQGRRSAHNDDDGLPCDCEWMTVALRNDDGKVVILDVPKRVDP